MKTVVLGTLLATTAVVGVRCEESFWDFKYILKRRVCCKQHDDLTLLPTDSVATDMRTLVDQLQISQTCDDEVTLAEQNNGKVSRGKSASLESVGVQLPYRILIASAGNMEQHIFGRKKGDDNMDDEEDADDDQEHNSKCLSVSVTVSLPFKLSRQFKLNYVTAHDFDQLSSSRSAGVKLSWGPRSQKPESALQSSEYEVTERTAKLVSTITFEDESIDQWARRERNESDTYQQLLQYLIISSLSNGSKYRRSMWKATFERMAAPGDFVAFCGDEVVMKNESLPEIPALSLEYYFPLRISGKATATISGGGGQLNLSVDEKECLLFKFENHEPEAPKPTRAYMIRMFGSTGFVDKAVNSMAFNNVLEADINAVTIAALPYLQHKQAAILSACAEDMAAPTGVSTWRDPEAYFAGVKPKLIFPYLGSLATLPRNPDYPSCLNLAVYGILKYQTFAEAAAREPGGFSVIISRWERLQPVHAMAFWRMSADSILSLLGLKRGSKLSVARAFKEQTRIQKVSSAQFSLKGRGSGRGRGRRSGGSAAQQSKRRQSRSRSTEHSKRKKSLQH